MLKKILVALDGSELAESILPFVNELASKMDAELYMFGVAIESDSGTARLVETYLEKTAQDFRNKGIKARAVLSRRPAQEILYGSPAQEILNYSEKNGVDLLAMTTHGRSGVGRWLLGSTAEKVIQGAAIPVFMVRGNEKAAATVSESLFKNILTPLDSSESSEQALNLVEAIAPALSSAVTLLYINPPLYKLVGDLEYPAPFPEEVVQGLKAAGQAYLKNIQERMGQTGVKTSYDMLTGDPAEKILGYARDKNFSLIAMSTHGRSGIARWVLGSVADKIIHNSEIPVLLVRAKGKAAAPTVSKKK